MRGLLYTMMKHLFTFLLRTYMVTTSRDYRKLFMWTFSKTSRSFYDDIFLWILLFFWVFVFCIRWLFSFETVIVERSQRSRKESDSKLWGIVGKSHVIVPISPWISIRSNEASAVITWKFWLEPRCSRDVNMIRHTYYNWRIHSKLCPVGKNSIGRCGSYLFGRRCK